MSVIFSNSSNLFMTRFLYVFFPLFEIFTDFIPISYVYKFYFISIIYSSYVAKSMKHSSIFYKLGFI